jgi:enediyne biosynthesis protein E4
MGWRPSAVAFASVAFLWGAASEIPQFVDVGGKAGLTDIFYCGDDNSKRYIIEALGGGVALLDYDNDGFPDVFFVTGSRLDGFPPGEEPTNQLYHNNRDGTFTRVTREAGLALSGWGQGVCAGDYDNDGNIDLFVTYFGKNHLYRNNGKGQFVEVTKEAGLDEDARWSTGCAFLDYDRDGKLDLFVASYIAFELGKVPLPGASPNCTWKGEPVMCGPKGLQGGNNRLFHNEGNGRFRNVSKAAGISAPGERYSLSVTPLDYNHDGWPDIYVAVDSQPSILFRNNRDGTFTDVGVEAGVGYSEDGREQSGMGSAAGDFDGDGRLDLVKTNFIDDTSNLYRNNGDGTFEDLVQSSGMARKKYMGWGVGFFDFDNDGWPDIFVVNGHVYPEIESKISNSPYRESSILYRNLNGKRVDDVSQLAGPAVLARHSGRGLAFGDFDNDGNVDVFVNNMNELPSLLRNRGSANHFVSLQLVGTKSNRSAIGARVSLYAGGMRQVQEVRSGSTFLSQSDLRLHFGLGGADTVDRVEIEWPYPQSTEVVSGFKANQFITITEGRGVTDVQQYHAR